MRVAVNAGTRLGAEINRFPVPIAPEWTPAQIATEAWYDANDISTFTLVGIDVQQWRDKSGNARHANQVTPANRLKYQASDVYAYGKPSVRNIDEITPRWLTLNNGISFGAKRVYAVLQYKDSMGLTSNHASLINNFSNGGGSYRITGRANDNDWDYGISVNPNSFEDAGAFKNGSINKTFHFTPEPLTVWRFDSTVSRVQAWRIMNAGANYTNWYGSVCELIMTDGSENPKLVEGYLAWKWGTVNELNYEHDFKLFKPRIGVTAPPKNWSPVAMTAKAWYDLSNTSGYHQDNNAYSVTDVWDKSGNDYKLYQSTLSKRPLVGGAINDLKALDFDGVNDIMSTTTTALSYLNGSNKPICLFAVVKSDNINADTFFATVSRLNSALDRVSFGQMWLAEAQTRFHIINTSNQSAVNDRNFVPTTNAYLYMGGTDGSTGRQRINGDDMTGTSTGFPHGTLTSTGYINMGASVISNVASQFFDGKIGEILVLDNMPSQANIDFIEGYLAHKWGLVSSLPVSHPYKNSKPIL